jgi:hypothetical protein
VGYGLHFWDLVYLGEPALYFGVLVVAQAEVSQVCQLVEEEKISYGQLVSTEVLSWVKGEYFL